MALRHAAVFRNPGSYVASPASSSATLIWRRSTGRIVPSWMGSSYVLPVRLSVTDRVLFDTRIVLGNGWGKITSKAVQGPSPPSTVFHRPVFWVAHDQARLPQTGYALPDALCRRCPAGPAAGGPRLPRMPVARDHARGRRDRRERLQGDGGPIRRPRRGVYQAGVQLGADRRDRRIGAVGDGPRLSAERFADGQAGERDRRVPRACEAGPDPVPHGAPREEARGPDCGDHRRPGSLSVESARGGEAGRAAGREASRDRHAGRQPG